MYQVTVNEGEPLELNPEAFNWDCLALEDGKFHLLKDGKSIEATVVSADYETKSFNIQIRHRLYQVQLKDNFDLLLEELGMENLAIDTINDIDAPMPGLVLQVLVEPGQEVAKGDSLLILEAMKMENVIKATGEGLVAAIPVKEGEAVTKGQVLIEFE